jgi:2'-5' RNA ligase
VTLGRVREGQRLPVKGLDDHAERFEPVPFVAQELVLYESVLTTGGPRYESRLTMNLGE